MKSKETPWFDGNVKPVRDGVYKRRYRGGGVVVFSKFNNGEWYVGFSNNPIYAFNSIRHSPFQFLPWRGLAQDPNEPKPK